jgi:hypothetical protein
MATILNLRPRGTYRELPKSEAADAVARRTRIAEPLHAPEFVGVHIGNITPSARRRVTRFQRRERRLRLARAFAGLVATGLLILALVDALNRFFTP